jgi:DNA-binding Lrp family transcriptional regulator
MVTSSRRLREGSRMSLINRENIQAYLFIEAKIGEAHHVGKYLADAPGVRQVALTAGPYDVVAKAEVSTSADLTRLVAGDVHAIPGVNRTITCQVTSQHPGSS